MGSDSSIADIDAPVDRHERRSRSNESLSPATSLVRPYVHLEQVRFLDLALVPLDTDLGQNDELKMAQRGRYLDAYEAARAA
jgi:hypothetical protein